MKYNFNMQKQGDIKDLGQSIVVAASNKSQSEKLESLLGQFFIADKSKFIISLVEKLLIRYDGETINFDWDTTIISTGKGAPEDLYNEVGNAVMGLYIMNIHTPNLAQQLIEEAGQFQEKLSKNIDHWSLH